MALDVTAGQFILPQGQPASETLMKAGQLVYQRNLQKERLRLQQEQKKDEAGKFLSSYLDPKHYLTGSEYDPVVTSKLNATLQKASAMAQNGSDIPSLLMAIGPDMADINEYSSKAKAIETGIKQNLDRIKNEKGYVPDAILDTAKKMAFHDIDPKTGQFGGLKQDISTVDPSKNYVVDAIKKFPELTTNGEGLEDFVSKVPMKDYSSSVEIPYAGRTKKVSFEAKHPFYMDLQRDDKGSVITDKYGNPAGLGVQGEPITDDDHKVVIDKTTGKPYTALNKQDYRTIMGLHPAIADHMRGEVKMAFQETGQAMPPEGSQQWEVMARHILFEELKNNDKSHFKPLTRETENANVMKMEMGPEYLNLLRGESRARAEGTAEGKENAGVGPKIKPLNVAQTTNEIFNNNPDYLNGENKNIDGHRVLDVTGNYQGAEFRFGHGEKEAYDKVYYDPKRRVLITQDKDFNTTEHKESELPGFLQKVAGANKLNPSYINTYLNKGGYRQGKYTNPQDVTGVIGNLDNAEQGERRKRLDDFFTNGKKDALKGVNTPMGKITEADESGWFGKGKYYIKVKGKDEKIPFTSKEKLEEFIMGAGQQPAAAPPAGSTPAKPKGKSPEDALIDKYMQ